MCCNIREYMMYKEMVKLINQEYAKRISVNAKQFSILNFSWQMRLKEFNLLLEQWNSEI